MDNDVLNYFWKRVWWGLEPKQELLDYFRNYGGTIIPQNELEETYHALQKRKLEIITANSSEKLLFEKLHQAFKQLNQQGILAVHFCGTSMSDGKSEIQELAQLISKEVIAYKLDFDPDSLKGYCFYHEQDIEDFVPDMEDGDIPSSYFYLAHGSLNKADQTTESHIAKKIVRALKDAGLDAEWDEDPTGRIKVNDFSWIKETDETNWNGLTLEMILETGYHQQNRCTEIPIQGQTFTFTKGKFNKISGAVVTVNTENKTVIIEAMLFGRLISEEMSFDEFAESIKNN